MANQVRRWATYQIVCKATGRRYIGSTNDFAFREKHHLQKLRRGVHHNRPLQEDFHKFGEAAFMFLPIEYFEGISTNYIKTDAHGQPRYTWEYCKLDNVLRASERELISLLPKEKLYNRTVKASKRLAG